MDHRSPSLQLSSGALAGRVWPKHRMPVALAFSAAWHGAALAGCVLAPSAWPWWLAGTAADHAIVTAAGLWPRSRLLGPNWTRLPDVDACADAIALTIDDGPDPTVTPYVLDLLDELGVRATFFCIGERARRYPALTREIRQRGHAVENHSQNHRHTFSVRGPVALAREIDAAQQTLTDITGARPVFFRAPAGLRNVFLEAVLQKLDLHLAAWTRRGFDTREPDAHVVQKRLLKGLSARDILLLHDGGAAQGANGRAVILDVLPGIAAAARRGGFRTVTLRDAAFGAQKPVEQTPLYGPN